MLLCDCVVIGSDRSVFGCGTGELVVLNDRGIIERRGIDALVKVDMLVRSGGDSDSRTPNIKINRLVQ